MTRPQGNDRNSIPKLPPPPSEEVEACCDAARRFSLWVDKQIAAITAAGTKQPTAYQLRDVKALLVDQYRMERNGATAKHRDRLTDRGGAPCLHGIFIVALERLATLPVEMPKIPRNDPTPTMPKEPTLAELILQGQTKKR